MPDDSYKSTTASYSNSSGTTPARNVEPNRVPDESKVNPLSAYSSCAYNITLYVLSPEAVKQFVLTNKIPLSGEGENYYIVAQSGGINKNDSRAITNSGTPGPYPGLDYYIDNLVMEIIAPLRNSSPIAAAEVSFDIVEPLGFTFLTKLSEACNKINESSAIIRENNTSKPNLWQQHYLLSIKFFGYDKDGDVVTSQSELQQLERYFPVLISKVDYKIDGKPTTYKVTGTLMSVQAAFGAKRGIVLSDSTIVARTVGQALGESGNTDNGTTGLIKILNDELRSQLNKDFVSKNSVYSIEWENNEIKNSELVNQAAYDAAQTAFNTTINTSKDSTIATANKTNAINVSNRELKIKAGTPIVKVIDNIITQSTYVTDKLRAKNNSQIEVDSIAAATKSTILDWFSISSKVYPTGRDSKSNEWTYNITYQIHTFKIPYLRSPLKNYSSPYHGAYKKYNYFLTGKNSEILSFEQTYDNHFYIIRPLATNTDKSDASKTGGVPTIAMRGSQGSLDQAGLNQAGIPADSVRANLSSLADQSRATMKILGDPDLLMDSLGNPADFNSGEFSKWYGSRGYAINPIGGQVFIEIIFNVADDYNLDGYLNVSDQLQFYDDDRVKKSGINGIVYWVTGVTNTFSKGLFSQELDLIYVPSSLLLMPTSTESDSVQRESTTNQDQSVRTGTTSTSSDSTTTGNTGSGGTTNQSQRNSNTSNSSSVDDDANLNTASIIDYNDY